MLLAGTMDLKMLDDGYSVSKKTRDRAVLTCSRALICPSVCSVPDISRRWLAEPAQLVAVSPQNKNESVQDCKSQLERRFALSVEQRRPIKRLLPKSEERRVKVKAVLRG
jgi:hypothetical protein